MYHTNTSTVRSIVVSNVLVFYGMLVRLVCTFKQRTKVPYSYLRKKRVPYFLAKIDAYQTVLTYLTVLSRLILAVTLRFNVFQSEQIEVYTIF